MGMITDALGLLFGSNRNVIAETAEVFRVNAEGADQREVELRGAALKQFATEFAAPQVGLYDRLVNGLNRLPRPMMAFGTIGLMASAMIAPVWFAERMVGVGLVPEPLWWLMGAIVSFYFGARYQVEGQRFQRSIAETIARVPQVTAAIRDLGDLEEAPDSPRAAETGTDAATTQAALVASENPALRDWAATRP